MLPGDTMECLRLLVVAVDRWVGDALRVARDLGGAPALWPHLSLPDLQRLCHPLGPSREPGAESYYCMFVQAADLSPRRSRKGSCSVGMCRPGSPVIEKLKRKLRGVPWDVSLCCLCSAQLFEALKVEILGVWNQ